MSRSRRARGGCSSATRSAGPARRRSWPRRWRRARRAGASGEPRAIARTPVGCVSCCPTGGCRRRGFPPEHVRRWRSRARMRHTLIDERTAWMQRIQATLFHHGIGGTPDKLRTREGRELLAALTLPQDARERIQIALAMVDAIDAQIAPLERELRQLARRQTGCKALMRLYGMGELTS